MSPADAIAKAAMDALGFVAFALLLTYLAVMAARCDGPADESRVVYPGAGEP